MPHYFDFGATSAIRPPQVVEAVASFLRDCGATPGRGGYGRALEAGRIALHCRRALMELLGVRGDPGRIAFFQNATHALNTALWGLVGEGEVLVVTQFDHNAVLRPAHALARERGVEVRMVPGDASGALDLEAARRLLDGARVLVVNAASNVLGSRLPVRDLVELAREAGALVVADAAQAAGHLPAAGEVGLADVVAFTGHKGLLGPQGIGGLWVREGVDVAPLLCGGTGGRSEIRDMPPHLPDRLEAGTVNAPGIAGLLAGCRFVLERGVEELHAEEARLKARLHAELSTIEGLRVLSPPDPEGVGIVTVVSDRLDPATLASRLDREWGIEARAGLHCAPEAHRVLGTLETGALRLSVGWCTTDEDVDQAVRALDALAGHTAVPVL
ncbi:MAG: aminotransferase class V-fold PLP-dependent enzyme [Gemmatimonadetes bacterium]|nr:MAG: aminotransferase class V-fold PLP-dependent enzyme [Gemmatimonadota bacterium]